jgi:hypothetical protein
MKRLLLAAVLFSSLASFAQNFAGNSGGDVFIAPPYRFCIGNDDGHNVCFTQIDRDTAGITGLLSGGVTTLVNRYFNSPSGTVCNGLAKIDTSGPGFNGKAVGTSGGEVTILGVVVSGCGTTGSANVVGAGPALVVFDSASITVGDFFCASLSPNVATDCGGTQGSGQFGQITLSPTGQLPSGCTATPGCWVLVQMGSGGGGGGSQSNAVVTNPSTTLKNTIQPIATGAVPATAKCPGGAASTDACIDVQDNTGNHLVQAQQNGQVNIGGGSTKGIATKTSSNTDLAGELTNSSGTSTYAFTGTYASHPICTASDVTSIAAVKVTYTGTTSVTFTTAGASDVLEYQCIGRN